MQLIRVSDKVLINPDMVSSVEIRGTPENPRLVVKVDNKDHVVANAKQFLDELIDHGINLNDQFFRI